MNNYLLKSLLAFPFILFLSCQKNDTPNFLIDPSSEITIYIDENSEQLIEWAANDLASDVNAIIDSKIEVKTTGNFHPDSKGIYIGKSGGALAESFPKDLAADLSGQWEKFAIRKHEQSLFITGSDTRGTVFGIFEVAERLGISPWKWWADVPLPKSDRLVLNLPPSGITESPSVQYRGIFLNDEDWGLQPWAAHTFEPETGDIGPKTYEKIFQLLLRLKANTIWPAMHPSTKAFFLIPGNREMAEKYHIMVGTSHAEPMLRNNVGEWSEEERGDYNYFTNSEKVKAYWEERIEEIDGDNYIFTLGMRGIHDSGMEGSATEEEKVQQLTSIIKDQRKMLTDHLDKPLDQIPQVLIPYKEVLELYDAGLEVPEDITLMWTDDNYGYIRRLSNENEQHRPGGSGVYYHISYWGRPHDYLWLSSMQPGLIWFEMMRAHQNGAQKIWILNVGDIKPAEYDMEFFLDLAWDVHSISEDGIRDHLEEWADREFGSENAKEIAHIMGEYYRLASLRKPEFMGWSQTEPITATRMTEFNLHANGNELQRRIDAYSALSQKVDSVKQKVPESHEDAFFQLVEYPVKGAALINQKFLFAQQSYLTTAQNEKEQYADKALHAYDSIAALTEKYNAMGNGKWNKMMSMEPRGLPAYAFPKYHLSESTESNEPLAQQKNSPLFIQGSEFSKGEGSGDYQWKPVEGLGYSDAAVTLFPFQNTLFEQKKPFLEYTFDIKEAGEYYIEIRCLPTHANNFGHAISVEVVGKDPKTYSLNTQGRSEEWKENVLRNFVAVKYPVTFDAPGSQTLRLAVNQSGIVLDQLAIIPSDYPDFYEIPKNKP